MSIHQLLFLVLGIIGIVLFGLLGKAKALSPQAWAGIVIGCGITGAIFSLAA